MSLGARLRQYRTARSYSLDDLVKRMDGLVSKQALSKYEHDRATPRPTVLAALARALDVNTSQLLAEPRYRFEAVAFRALSSLPKKEREAIESTVQLELERRLALMDKLGIAPAYPFNDVITVADDFSQVERAAEELRYAWNLGGGPISSVVDTLESKGVHLIDVDSGRAFDGLAVIARDDAGERVACGVAARLEIARARQRMNHAHELGHLAMQVAECVDEEAAARRFAGAFLYPAEAVRADFGVRRNRVRVHELLAAKERWGISVQAVLFRLRDLSVIDETNYTWWCRYVNQAGWRTEEPGEQPRERSTWAETHALRAEAEGLIARDALAQYAPALVNAESAEPLDRRTLMSLPLSERRALMKAQADALSAQYNRTLDREWLDADLGEWDSTDD
jgi:transcriptional regulator with XRE-family HTH domain